MAIILAMDAVAHERSAGTLSFLLDKPMSSATVLAVKFLVGLGGLLLVALALGDGISGLDNLEVGQGGRHIN